MYSLAPSAEKLRAGNDSCRSPSAFSLSDVDMTGSQIVPNSLPTVWQNCPMALHVLDLAQWFYTLDVPPKRHAWHMTREPFVRAICGDLQKPLTEEWGQVFWKICVLQLLQRETNGIVVRIQLILTHCKHRGPMENQTLKFEISECGSFEEKQGVPQPWVRAPVSGSINVVGWHGAWA